MSNKFIFQCALGKANQKKMTLSLMPLLHLTPLGLDEWIARFPALSRVRAPTTESIFPAL